MLWYLLNICFIILAWIWPVRWEPSLTQARVMQIRSKRTCIVATVDWIVLSGFRAWTVGVDTLAYQSAFDANIHRTWYNLWMNFYLKYMEHAPIKDPLYELIVKSFHIVSDNYQVFLIFIAFVFFIPLGFYIYRYSRHACLSFILFSSLFYAFFAITGHRQTIATSLVVFGSLPLIRQRRLILFLLLIAFASTIHASVVCFLPFYWISKIPINKWILCGYWLGIVLIFMFRNNFLSLLQSFVGYQEYQKFDNAGAPTFMFFLFLLALFATFFSKRLINSSNTYTQMSMHALFLACLFSPLLLINPSCMRVVQYYSLFLLFLIPEYTRAFKTELESKIFYCICSAILIALLIKDNPTYEFCW